MLPPTQLIHNTSHFHNTNTNCNIDQQNSKLNKNQKNEQMFILNIKW